MINRKKLCAALLSGLTFTTNCALIYATETNFWSERKEQLNQQLASLPASFPEIPHDPSLLHSPLLPLSPLLRRQLTEQKAAHQESKFISIVRALPSQAGSVRSIRIPSGGGTGKTILYIQDIHLNTEAQQNISSAIGALTDLVPVDLVAVEGAFREKDFSTFRNPEYHLYVKQAADELLKQNYIAGPMHASLSQTTDKPAFIGVDEAEAYQANIKAYRSSLAHTADLKKKMSALEQNQITAEKTNLNPKLLSMENETRAYETDQITLGAYLTKLAPFASQMPRNVEVFLEARNLETQMDLSAIQKERGLVLEKLTGSLRPEEMDSLIQESVNYRLGRTNTGDFYGFIQNLCRTHGMALKKFPHFNSYLQYVLLSDSIDMEQIYQEIKTVQQRAFTFLIKTPQEKELVDHARRLHLTAKLLDFGLTPDEWTEYKSLNSNHESFYLGFGLDDSTLKPFETFYKQAELRDSLMAAHTVAAMRERKASTGILVTGGFHATGVTEQLVKQGYTVISFVPRITEVSPGSDNAYLSVFAQEKSPLDKIFEGQKLFLAIETGTGSQGTEVAGEATRLAIQSGAVSPSRAQSTFKKIFPVAKELTVKAFKTGAKVVLTIALLPEYLFTFRDGGKITRTRTPKKYALTWLVGILAFSVRTLTRGETFHETIKATIESTPSLFSPLFVSQISPWRLGLTVTVLSAVVIFFIWLYHRKNRGIEQILDKDRATGIEPKMTAEVQLGTTAQKKIHAEKTRTFTLAGPQAPRIIELGKNPFVFEAKSSEINLRHIRELAATFYENDVAANLPGHKYLVDERVSSLPLILERMIQSARGDSATSFKLAARIASGSLEVIMEDNAKGNTGNMDDQDGWIFNIQREGHRNIRKMTLALLRPSVDPAAIEADDDLLAFMKTLETPEAIALQMSEIRTVHSKSPDHIPFLLACLRLNDPGIFVNACETILKTHSDDNKNLLVDRLIYLYKSTQEKQKEINFLIAWYLARKNLNQRALDFRESDPNLKSVTLPHDKIISPSIKDAFGPHHAVFIREQAPRLIIVETRQIKEITQEGRFHIIRKPQKTKTNEVPSLVVVVKNGNQEGPQFEIDNLANTEWSFPDGNEKDFVLNEDLRKSGIFEILLTRWATQMPPNSTITLNKPLVDFYRLDVIESVANKCGLARVTLNTEKIVYRKSGQNSWGGDESKKSKDSNEQHAPEPIPGSADPNIAASAPFTALETQDERNVYLKILGSMEERAHKRAAREAGLTTNEEDSVEWGNNPITYILDRPGQKVQNWQLYHWIKAGISLWINISLTSLVGIIAGFICLGLAPFLFPISFSRIIFQAILLILEILFSFSFVSSFGMLVRHYRRYAMNKSRKDHPSQWHDLTWVIHFRKHGTFEMKPSFLAQRGGVKITKRFAFAPFRLLLPTKQFRSALQSEALNFPTSARAPFVPIDEKEMTLSELFQTIEAKFSPGNDAISIRKEAKAQIDRLMGPLKAANSKLPSEEELVAINGSLFEDDSERQSLIRLLAFVEARVTSGYKSTDTTYLIWLLEKLDNPELYQDSPDLSKQFFDQHPDKIALLENKILLAQEWIKHPIAAHAPFAALPLEQSSDVSNQGLPHGEPEMPQAPNSSEFQSSEKSEKIVVPGGAGGTGFPGLAGLVNFADSIVQSVRDVLAQFGLIGGLQEALVVSAGRLQTGTRSTANSEFGNTFARRDNSPAVTWARNYLRGKNGNSTGATFAVGGLFVLLAAASVPFALVLAQLSGTTAGVGALRTFQSTQLGTLMLYLTFQTLFLVLIILAHQTARPEFSMSNGSATASHTSSSPFEAIKGSLDSISNFLKNIFPLESKSETTKGMLSNTEINRQLRNTRQLISLWLLAPLEGFSGTAEKIEFDAAPSATAEAESTLNSARALLASASRLPDTSAAVIKKETDKLFAKGAEGTVTALETPLQRLDDIIKTGVKGPFTDQQYELLRQIKRGLYSANRRLKDSDGSTDEALEQLRYPGIAAPAIPYILLTLLRIKDDMLKKMRETPAQVQERVQEEVWNTQLTPEFYAGIILEYRRQAAPHHKQRSNLRSQNNSRRQSSIKGLPNDEVLSIGVIRAVTQESLTTGQPPAEVLRRVKERTPQSHRKNLHFGALTMGLSPSGWSTSTESNSQFSFDQIAQSLPFIRETAAQFYAQLVESLPFSERIQNWKLSNLFESRSRLQKIILVSAAFLTAAVVGSEMYGARSVTWVLVGTLGSLMVLDLAIVVQKSGRATASSPFSSSNPIFIQPNGSPNAQNVLELADLADVIVKSAIVMVLAKKELVPGTDPRIRHPINFESFLTNPILMEMNQKRLIPALGRHKSGKLTPSDMKLLFGFIQEKIKGQLAEGELTLSEAQHVVQSLVRWGLLKKDLKIIPDMNKDEFCPFNIQSPPSEAAQEIRRKLAEQIEPIVPRSGSAKLYLFVEKEYLELTTKLVLQQPYAKKIEVKTIESNGTRLFTNKEGVLSLSLPAIEAGLGILVARHIKTKLSNVVVLIPEGVTLDTAFLTEQNQARLSLLNQVSYVFQRDLIYGHEHYSMDLWNLEKEAEALLTGA